MIIFLYIYIYICLFFRPKTTKDDIKVASSILVSGDAELAGLYKPRTQETRQTFEVMLNFMDDVLGDNVSCYIISFTKSRFNIFLAS